PSSSSSIRIRCDGSSCSKWPRAPRLRLSGQIRSLVRSRRLGDESQRVGHAACVHRCVKSLPFTYSSRLCLVLALSGSAVGCYATTEPAVVEVYSVPPAISRYPSVFYDGHPVYLVDGHWYYRVGPRWYVYRRVPPPLVQQRRYIERRYIQRAPAVPL